MLFTQKYIKDKIEDFSIVYEGTERDKTLVDVEKGKLDEVKLKGKTNLTEELYEEYGGSYVVIDGKDLPSFYHQQRVEFPIMFRRGTHDKSMYIIQTSGDSNFKYNKLAQISQINGVYLDEDRIEYDLKEYVLVRDTQEIKYLDMVKLFKDISQKDRDRYFDAKYELSYVNLIEDILNLDKENGRVEFEYYKVKYTGWMALIPYSEHFNLNKKLGEILYQSKDTDISHEDKLEIYKTLDYYLGYLVNVNNKYNSNKYLPKDLKVGDLNKYLGKGYMESYVITNTLHSIDGDRKSESDNGYDVGSFNNKLFKFGGITDGTFTLNDADVRTLTLTFLPSYNITSTRKSGGMDFKHGIIDFKEKSKEGKKESLKDLLDSLNMYIELDNGLVSRLYKILYVDETGAIRLTDRCNILTEESKNYFKTYVCRDAELDYKNLVSVYKMLYTDFNMSNNYNKLGVDYLDKDEYNKMLDYQREYDKLYQESQSKFTDKVIETKWSSREQEELDKMTEIKDNILDLGSKINN